MNITTLLTIALLLISFFIAVFWIMIPLGNVVFPEVSTFLLVGVAVAIVFGVIFLGFMLVVVMRGGYA